MTNPYKPVFKPAPDGPPISKRAGRYTDLYKYLDLHPGEWVVVEGQRTSTIVSKWKAKGYEARSVWKDGKYDLYVRKPLPDIIGDTRGDVGTP